MNGVFLQPYPTRESREALREYNEAFIACKKRACEDPSFWTDEVEDELDELMIWNVKKNKGLVVSDIPPKITSLDFGDKAAIYDEHHLEKINSQFCAMQEDLVLNSISPCGMTL